MAWEITTIGEVAEINPRLKKNDIDDDTLASFVPMKCVEAESGHCDPPEIKKVGEVKKGYTPMQDNDVIMAKVTPCMENGKVAVVRGLKNGIGFGSKEFFVLRPSERILPEYLFCFIIQQSFRREAERHMTGAVGLRRVPRVFLENHEIPLPPFPEQRRIVARIEELFSRLDAGVAALRHAKAYSNATANPSSPPPSPDNSPKNGANNTPTLKQLKCCSSRPSQTREQTGTAKEVLWSLQSSIQKGCLSCHRAGRGQASNKRAK